MQAKNDKEYLPITGFPEFTKQAAILAYGKDSKPLQDGRVSSALSTSQAKGRKGLYGAEGRVLRDSETELTSLLLLYNRLPSPSPSLEPVLFASPVLSSSVTTLTPRPSTSLPLPGATTSPSSRTRDSRSRRTRTMTRTLSDSTLRASRRT